MMESKEEGTVWMDKNEARERDFYREFFFFIYIYIFYRELEGHDKESKFHSCMGHMVCSLIGEMV